MWIHGLSWKYVICSFWPDKLFLDDEKVHVEILKYTYIKKKKERRKVYPDEIIFKGPIKAFTLQINIFESSAIIGTIC